MGLFRNLRDALDSLPSCSPADAERVYKEHGSPPMCAPPAGGGALCCTRSVVRAFEAPHGRALLWSKSLLGPSNEHAPPA